MRALLPISAYILAGLFAVVGAALMFVVRRMDLAFLSFGAAAGAAIWAGVLWMVLAVLMNTF